MDGLDELIRNAVSACFFDDIGVNRRDGTAFCGFHLDGTDGTALFEEVIDFGLTFGFRGLPVIEFRIEVTWPGTEQLLADELLGDNPSIRKLQRHAEDAWNIRCFSSNPAGMTYR
jgi:hypothetical protein